MSDHDISQEQADLLLQMQKRRRDETLWSFPGISDSISVPLASMDGREEFILDVARGRIDLLKATYQNRARHILVLARLDLGGPPHRNPDGEEISSPHLHLYREGFDTKWACALPPDQFTNPANLFESLQHFMAFCKVVEPPLFDAGLF
jgi:hypothetical protein